MAEEPRRAPRRQRRPTLYPRSRSVPLSAETHARIDAASERYDVSAAALMRAAIERGLPAELDRLARLQRKANAIRQERQERDGKA